MFLIIRYSLIMYLYGIVLIVFSSYIYFHMFLQVSLSYLAKEPTKIYDYIIVGSGTAGSIITLRLAQEGKNVLLLEAGPYSNFLFDIPAVGPLLQGSALDWQYETVPQAHACKGLTNNVSRWPMGKIFGGTHRFNNMLHVRGQKEDFDTWYQNMTDYNYDRDILQYYKKLENSNNIFSNSPGPIYLNNLNFESPVGDAIVHAAQLLQKDQTNAEFTKPRVTLKNGKRWTTSDALLNRNFPNLTIITNAQVTKILFKNNYEAYAVQFNHLGTKKTIKAKHGIILSAGVIGTPKILLLSGIGPSEHLKQLKIAPKINLPIGNNLIDHVTTGLDLITLNRTLPISAEALLSPMAAYKYFFNGSGPWTTVGCEAIGFCSTEGKHRKPNLEFLVVPLGATTDGGKHLKNTFSIKPHIWDSYFTNLIGKQVISILPIVLHPKSTGTVRLRNSNPNSAPIINPNYLSHQSDVNVLIEGIQMIKRLISTEPMQQLGAELYKEIFPGCEAFKFDSRNYWECYIRHLTLTSYHPVGTCKMGHSKDESAVVDYGFKVIGTNKLFIGDGSVFPSLPSGNPNAVVAMIAEKVADSVKWNEYLLKGACAKIENLVYNRFCIRF